MKECRYLVRFVLTFLAPIYLLFFGLHFALLSFGENSFLITSGVYSSDLVQPYLIAEDLLRTPSLIESWQFSPAIYLFPDLLLAVLFAALPVSAVFLPVFYGALLLTAYTCAIAYCFNGCLKIQHRHVGWLVAALLGLCSVGVVFWGGDLSKSVYFWLTSSFIHTGALLLTLFSVGLYIRMLEISSRAMFLSFVVLVFLISFSDLIYIEWFVIPSFVVAMIIYLAQKQLDAIRLSERLMVVALCGVILEMLLRRGTHLKSYLLSCNTNIGMFLDLYTRIVSGDLGLALIFMLNFGLLLHGAAIVLKAIDQRNLEKVDTLVLFLAASSISAFSFMALLGIYGCYIDAVMFRYMLPVFVSPLVWVMLGIAYMTHNRSAQWAVLLTIVLVYLVTTLSKPLSDLRDRFVLNNQASLLQCLSANNLTQGYAGYLDAKRLMFLSEGQVHLMQLDNEMNLMRPNYNGIWFSIDRMSLAPLQPNFVLIDHLDSDSVLRKFGSPSTTVRCSGHVIYVYQHGLSLQTMTANGAPVP